MWRNFPEPAVLIACYLPVLFVVGMAFLIMILPVARAPTVARVTKYTRKLVRDYPNASDDRLRRILRARFLPDWVNNQPPEVSFILFGLLAVAVPMYYWMRSFLLEQVVESRIRRAIDTVNSERDD
jgi:hypothetical protein